ncbi:MAG: nitrogenase [Leptolyngbya foveolarum]|uniref:Nitrogenase n=1 Tax=Leptolyngbya foveolarum TaxID=47253 RepID=A0A2W4UEU4_9CYAN|nr:MAG: nitrogenase [Leptolyngbya foveolarum]
MTSATQTSVYTSEQICVWLRGLLTIAWADGQFDEAEKAMIRSMVESEFAPNVEFDALAPIEPAELAALGLSDAAAQNFLRMAVMVALADGLYSQAENDQVMAFSEALNIEPAALTALQTTLENLSALDEDTPSTEAETGSKTDVAEGIRLLKPVRQWLDGLTVDDPRLARFVCKLVPAQCPFERDVTLFGRKTVHIPPMCKINPLYEQLVGLRFRAMTYLSDDLGEDITPYL